MHQVSNSLLISIYLPLYTVIHSNSLRELLLHSEIAAVSMRAISVLLAAALAAGAGTKPKLNRPLARRLQSCPELVADPLFLNVSVLVSPAIATSSSRVLTATQKKRDPFAAYTGFVVDMASVVTDRVNSALSETTTDDSGCDIFPIKYNALNVDRLVLTAAYGSRNATGNWSGAIGDLLSERTQMGVGLFPISPALVASGLQYSTPILSTGFTTLTRLQQAETDPWAFLKVRALQSMARYNICAA